jgi:fumarate hydratase class II
MAGIQVMANDLAVSIGNCRGEFQLNVLLPLICHNLLQSITLLSNAALMLADKVISGFSVNLDGSGSRAGANTILVTALTPRIGYDKAVEIVKRAAVEGKTVQQVAGELTDISQEDLERLLDPLRLAGRRPGRSPG